MKVILRGLVSRLLELAVCVLPKRGHVVVYGYPMSEGNAVETIRGLSRRYRGTIYWLDGPSEVEGILDGAKNVQSRRRMSIGALLLYATAETVFYTHGLYGNPTPNRRQPIVNLWHGDGVKAHNHAADSKRSIAPATYVVGGTKLLTERKAVDFKMAEDSLIVTGNPRVDQFRKPTNPVSLGKLGIEPGQPFVIWMPTFRKTRQVGVTPGWTDSRSDATILMEEIRKALPIFSARGVQLVIKPHPMDIESYNSAECVLVNDFDITASGTALYELLGASSGLLTDYSSVWTDYLLLDRPIGFIIPDKDDYMDGRGVYPHDAMDWLPGIEIDGPASVNAFIDEVLEGESSKDGRRALAADRLGLTRPIGASVDALLDQLEDLQAFGITKSLVGRASA